MATKYEKPLIVPFKSDRDEAGMGICSPAGSGDSGPCSDGGSATLKCSSGTGARGRCQNQGNSPGT